MKMLPPTVVVNERRRVGRPPIDDDTVLVGVTLPTKYFDELCERARRDDVSVPEVIRRKLGVTSGE